MRVESQLRLLSTGVNDIAALTPETDKDVSLTRFYELRGEALCEAIAC